MSILVLYYLLVVVAAMLAVTSVVLGARNGSYRWAVAVLLLFVVGAVWQEVAVRTFAAREPEGMRGLILRLVPLGGGDHEFTPNGEHYLKFAFIVPGAVSVASALIVGFIALVVSEGRRRIAGSVCLAVVGGVLASTLLALARLLAASEIFI